MPSIAHLPFFLTWLSDGRTDGRTRTYAGPIDDYQNTIFLSLTAERNSRARTRRAPSSLLSLSRPRCSKCTAMASRPDYPMPPRNFSESFFGAGERERVRHAVSRDVF